MPRTNRIDVAGEIYHVINRANARMEIFSTKEDYVLFEEVLAGAKERIDINIYAYCIMPNHWHLVVSPKNDGDLSKFVGWLTMTHTQRWHVAHKSIGSGHLYQGRYKSFMVQSNEYFLQVCRYVERNAVRAKLAKVAESWKWSSVWRKEKGSLEQKKLLAKWPVNIPFDYLEWVNEKDTKDTIDAIRTSVNKGKPLGSDSWTNNMVDMYKLTATLRGSGRPKKGS